MSAERPLTSSSAVKGGALRPVKLVLRRLMRWYVEPLAADQRAFNDAVLKLIDDLGERVDRLTEATRILEERVERAGQLELIERGGQLDRTEKPEQRQ